MGEWERRVGRKGGKGGRESRSKSGEESGKEEMEGKETIPGFIPWYRIESESLDDGHHYSPKSLFSWLTRVMYNRRTRINPLWNTIIIGGYDEQTP